MDKKYKPKKSASSIKQWRDFDKIMSKKNPKYKNLSVFKYFDGYLVGQAFAQYRKDPKRFEADLENRTQQFKLKSNFLNPQGRPKKFRR
tara:strand:+ start:1340 stop:1606 length:267 start_codon:yes stop_codon:yes gene_type:complete